MVATSNPSELTRPTPMVNAMTTTTTTTVTTSDWKAGLPVVTGAGFTLRELRLDDAASLLAMLTTEEVSRFISPPPTRVEGFERFILWAQRERQAGNYACFAVVPNGTTTAVGIFQVRSLEPGFATAEWGFALGSAFWGNGMFAQGARLVLDFAFDVLRRSFQRHSQYHDQVLWGILAEDWRSRRLSLAPATVIH